MVAVVMIGFISGVEATAQSEGEGTSFVLTFPYMSFSTNGGDERVRISIASATTTNVTIRYNSTGTVINRLVTANASQTVVIDSSDFALPEMEGTFDRTILITAADPVSASVILDRGTASEAYGCIPNEYLGLEYYALGEVSFGPGSFVAVAAVEDKTTVTITPTRITRNDNPAGTPYTVVLDKGEVYQVLSKPRLDPTQNDDLSGTHIVADRPVAVWSGSACARFEYGNFTCGPLIEQLPPLEAFGTVHPMGLFSGEDRAFWKLVSACGEIEADGSGFLPAFDTTLSNAGDWRYGALFADGTLQTSEKGLLVHLGPNISREPPRYVDSAVGDPTMALVTPVEQMTEEHRVVVPMLASRIDGGRGVKWQHYLNIVRSDPAAGATIDGAPVTFTGTVAVVPIEPGTYLVEGEKPIGITVNGRSVSDAYAFVPKPVARLWPLSSDGIVGRPCGDSFDTTIVIKNETNIGIRIDRYELLAGLQGQVVDPPFPFDVPPDGQRSVRVRFTNLQDGSSNGSIVLRAGDCDHRVLRIPVDLRPDRLRFNEVAIGATLEFPPIFPSDGASDATVTLRNASNYELKVVTAVLTPGQFTLASPGLPITLGPGASQPVVLRFTPNAGDVEIDGRVVFLTENCPEDSLFAFNLKGTVKYFDVLGAVEKRLLCEPKEVDTLEVSFINKGVRPIDLNRIELEESDVPGEFEMLPGTGLPVSVQAGDTLRVFVRYVPGPLGLREAALLFEGEGTGFDSIRSMIRITNDLIRVEIDSDSLDLGVRVCDASVVGTVSIRNTGNVPVNNVLISLSEGRVAQLDADLPAVLQPGEAFDARVFVTDGEYGKFTDTMHISLPQCDISFDIPIKGRCAVGTIELAWGDDAGAPGDRVRFPLSIEAAPAPFALGAPVSIRFTARFLRGMFLEDERFTDVVDGLDARILGETVEGGRKALDILITGQIPENGRIATLEGMALLGIDSVTALTIDSLEFDILSDIFDAEVLRDEGSLRVLGICYVGSARLVDASGTFGLRVAPNPVRQGTTVRMGLVEDGRTTLILVDAAGRHVATAFDGNVEAGEWDIEFDPNDIPQGRYRLLLQTPSQSTSVPITILR